MRDRIQPPEDGIHEDIDFETYCAWDAWNSSAFKDFTLSPWHILSARKGETDNDSPTKLLGRAAHAAVLEGPTAFKSRYTLAPDINKNHNDYKAWAKNAKAKGIEIITKKQHDTVLGIAGSINRHDQMKALVLTPGAAEVSCVWTCPETGLRCKMRCDRFLAGQFIFDLKTCANAASRAIQGDAIAYGYDIQAAHYLQGLRVLAGTDARFIWGFVETDAPFAINLFTPDAAMLKSGRIRLKTAMSIVRRCVEENNWPLYSNQPGTTYSTEVRDLPPPVWRERELQYEIDPEETHL